jgi:two-component system, OmpR family, phosphate regulon response regulator OmpR
MEKITPKILVVDDDARLRELLERYLGANDFKVTSLASARELERKLERDPPHLIVLDWMMPGEDGMAVCRNLRAAGDMTPIIMLTAKSEDEERIAGLDSGADDYVSKPFNPQELVARINAVLRRSRVSTMAAAPGEEGTISFGPFTLNLGTRELTREGEALPLTTGEFSVLRIFVTHPREPLTRDRLMMLARGREHEVFDRAIDVQISRLRKLIEPDATKPRYIQTVWGFGYVFVPDEAGASGSQ